VSVAGSRVKQRIVLVVSIFDTSNPDVTQQLIGSGTRPRGNQAALLPEVDFEMGPYNINIVGSSEWTLVVVDMDGT
jgi:hypothetical protein